MRSSEPTRESTRSTPLDDDDVRVVGYALVSLAGSVVALVAAYSIEPALAALIAGAVVAVAGWRAM